jgi:hypothetical protein
LSVGSKKNNNLNKNKTELLKKGIEVAEKTGNFVIDQAPLLLQEFYRWHIASSIISIIIGVGIYLIGRYLPVLWLAKERTSEHQLMFFGKFTNHSSSWEEKISGSWILYFLSITISLIMVISSTYKLVYILVAPKLYLIEYFIK